MGKIIELCVLCCFLTLSTAQSKYVTLNNGYEIPTVGYGTCGTISNESVEPLEVALEAEYRHIDTSPLYENEALVGDVLNRWIKSGKLNRSDIYLVSSLPPSGMRPEHVSMFLKDSLKKLQVDYLDLYLIAYPVGMNYVEGQLYPMTPEGKFDLDFTTNITSVYKAMEEQVDLGLARSIGISNFNISQMQRILDVARIPPAVHQIEVHLYGQNKEVVQFCKDHNIAVTAWSPLGNPGYLRSTPLEIEDSLVFDLAEKYNKTKAQILLRHAIQKGLIVIPKSKTPSRIKLNIDVFDFELDVEDMKWLDARDKGKSGKIQFTGFDWVKVHPEYSD